MAFRARSASAPAVFPLGGKSTDGPAPETREQRPSSARRRPTIAGLFSRKASTVAAPEVRTAPEQAWDSLHSIIKKLPKPNPDATPPITLDDIHRNALREWMASSNPDMGGGDGDSGTEEQGEAGNTQRVPGLTEYQVEFFSCMMARVKELQHEEAKGKADDMYTALSISYGDMGTDIAVGVQLLNSAHPEQGRVTFGILGWSLFCQTFSAVMAKQGPLAVLASAMGGKPLYDTYHVMAETPRRKDELAGHGTILVITHMIEVTCESVPLGLYTTALLVQASAEERSTVQMLSVLASILAIAYMSASSARDHDFNSDLRKEQPQLFGWFPSEPWPQTVTFVGLNLFIGGVFTAKMASLAALFTASGTIGTSWLVSECLVLLALRVAADDWRGHAQGIDSVPMSLLLHLWEYIMIMAVPNTSLREPHFTGPAFYAGGTLYGLLVNFAQVAVAFHIDGGAERIQMHPSTMYLIVAGSAGLALLGMAFVMSMMEPRYRKTFFKHRTMRTYLTEWHCTLAAHSGLGVGHDSCMAEVIVHYSTYHWPAPEILEAWLLKWPEFERAETPPPWFTDEWKAHALRVVPPGLLPEEVRPRSTFKRWR